MIWQVKWQTLSLQASKNAPRFTSTIQKIPKDKIDNKISLGIKYNFLRLIWILKKAISTNLFDQIEIQFFVPQIFLWVNPESMEIFIFKLQTILPDKQRYKVLKPF